MKPYKAAYADLLAMVKAAATRLKNTVTASNKKKEEDALKGSSSTGGLGCYLHMLLCSSPAEPFARAPRGNHCGSRRSYATPNAAMPKQPGPLG